MNLIRTIVSGKKNRLKESQYNLDVTYICPRIMAMSFPGTGLQIFYRNNIVDVSQFMKERHGNDYQIYNLSGISYDYSKLGNNVLDFPWEDHCSPPINTLFRACQSIDEFLSKNGNNVVVIHCKAGKGRTGTLICCYLIYSGRFESYEQALDYYAKKRFSKGGGVTQPSQIRYVKYFEILFKQWKNIQSPVLKYIKSVKLVGIPKMSTNKGCRPYIQIYSVKDNQMIYNDKCQKQIDQMRYYDMGNEELNKINIIISTPLVVVGDVQINLLHYGKYADKKICRLAFNTAFVNENLLEIELKDLDPDNTCKDPRFPMQFRVEVHFAKYCECKCNSDFDSKCFLCKNFLENERQDWEGIHNIMMNYKQKTLKQSIKMLFGDPYFDDFKEVIHQSIQDLVQLHKDQEDEAQDDIWDIQRDEGLISTK